MRMKATGIVRTSDDLGRLVIPKQLAPINQAWEFFMGDDGTIILKKYENLALSRERYDELDEISMERPLTDVEMDEVEQLRKKLYLVPCDTCRGTGEVDMGDCTLGPCGICGGEGEITDSQRIQDEVNDDDPNMYDEEMERVLLAMDANLPNFQDEFGPDDVITTVVLFDNDMNEVPIGTKCTIMDEGSDMTILQIDGNGHEIEIGVGIDDIGCWVRFLGDRD